MSPAANFHGFHEQPKKVINGPRPSPLMIKRESHLIRKPSSSADTNKPHQQQPRNPIIIYAHSPKVIHTKPKDFMAVVQRLTGMSPQSRVSSPENFGSFSSDGSKYNYSIKQEQSVSEEKEEACGKGNMNAQLSRPLSNASFADFPLFTPNSSDFFCSSSRQVHKFSDSPFGVLASLISPSGLEFLRELPEY
ncbi:hypothetical protein L6164_026859 [Bauhinia variegata]|uniref:Uncharacterized protein n=1 Tax=Bauhinia variegata TaxID=167791 RepID=A0ACB9LSF8_BAUVA|nr:hypothetical protein L6164_026859 [Bauhinia variegata]